MSRKTRGQALPVVAEPDAELLIADLQRLIEEARHSVAQVVNMGLTLLYWRIGHRIRADVLGGQRAGYGEEIVSTLSRQLTADYGRSFSAKSLRHMIRFAEAFEDEGIVSTLSRQLAWSHFRELIYLKEPLARDFYAEMCRIERWSVRTLRDRVGSMLFERTALSKKPDELIRLELDAMHAQGDAPRRRYRAEHCS